MFIKPKAKQRGKRTVEQVLSLILSRINIPGSLSARARQLQDTLDSVESADIQIIDEVVSLIRESSIILSRRGAAMRQACETVTLEFHRAADALSAGNDQVEDTLQEARQRIVSSFETAGRYYQDDRFTGLTQAVVGNLNAMAHSVRATQQANARRLAGLHAQLKQAQNQLEETTQDLSDTLQIVNTDTLTGVANRLGYQTRLNAEIGRWKRHRMPLSLIYMDLDQFKSINDTHGHAVGDRILMEIGRLLQRSLRNEDLPARLGGDEFAIILPHVDLDRAHAFAQRLGSAIRQHTGFTPVGRLTASIGVTAALEGDDEATLTERADKAMYVAKFSGSDRVCVLDSKDEFEIIDPDTAAAEQAATG